MSNIKVSIIVPVYNVEKYLKDCLDSLINQTLKEIEIILINDGSKDNSLSICQEYAKRDTRIVLISQTNAGQAMARNRGLDIARGDYIGFVDSDDWIDEDFYEKLYNSAIKNDAQITEAGFVRVKSNNNKIRLHFEEENVYVSTEDKMKISNYPKEGCVWNKLYEKTLLNTYNIRFREGRVYEDGFFSIQALHYSNKLATVPSIRYYYRVNPVSTVKTKFTQKTKEDLFVAKSDILNFIRNNDIKIKTDSFLVPIKTFNLGSLPIISKKESVKTNNYYLFEILPIWKSKRK